jgi:hypothetical protein
MKNPIALLLTPFLTICSLFTPKELRRFYALDELIKKKYLNKKSAEINVLANEYLLLAQKYPNDWNYGNAIHKANIFLGLVALESGKIADAKNYLKSSGDTPGSPQLDSFGPNMLLAKTLLDHDQKQIVLEYLEQLRIFWVMDDGKLDTWKSQIERGESPDFGANLEY